ncbi:MAG: glycosyltransferase family 2 protein, partial [Candidatus Izemoplasmatales bacterium]
MIDKIIYITLIFFGFVSFIFIVLILTQKRRHKNKIKKTNQSRDYLFKKYIDKEETKLKFSSRFFLEAFIDVEEQIIIEDDVRQTIIDELLIKKFVKEQIKLINSHSQYKRLLATFYVGRLRTTYTNRILLERFKIEKSEAVRLSIISNIKTIEKKEDFESVIESVIDSSYIYLEKLCTLLGSNNSFIKDNLFSFLKDNRYEIVLAIIKIAEFKPEAKLIDYMIRKLKEIIKEKPYSNLQNDLIKEAILKNLLKHMPSILSQEFCDDIEDEMVKKYAILALVDNSNEQCLTKLIGSLDGGDLDEVKVATIAKIIQQDRLLFDHVLRIFNNYDQYRKAMISKSVSQRIDYVILNNYNTNRFLLNQIISYMFDYEIIEPIIDFLNNNSNIDIENSIIKIIKNNLIRDFNLNNEFRLYLKPDILLKMGLQPIKHETKPKEKAPVEKAKVIWVIKWISFACLLFPIIYLVKLNVKILDITFKQFIEGFLIDVNFYLIYYFVFINMIYIVLFILALIGSKHQVYLSKTKKYSLLFNDKFLPGISIIAPAYNEEVSIIDSVTSLLNLKYPDYQVVVVNDGSKDSTLVKLISYFKLERKHYIYKNYLNTKKIRGIYTTKEIPNLIVVDKQNGGKADALNVGINVSTKAYVCGIDADSILEGDALLKLASAMLDDTKPVLAMGGNIYPANGFIFNKGQVEKRGIPKEMICRFQTIEYLRAFTSGRIGWSQLKSLMIISGAFGLFDKKALIDDGGYLTSSGTFKKDTVGEDMELVVRLSTESLKKKKNERVLYVYNAYCYTELPSDTKTLLKQRNRWQRGLIDILSYHRQIAFDQRY